DDPAPWTARSLVAHFLSSERELLRLLQDVASGGPGAPEGSRWGVISSRELKL
ncbi:hypothetical protein IMZ48_12135, partial [Candidatus Bathyarchaeota archaeon]|nr:hypothetical protein [Candidatus Bathyarchaeota archaeon]